MFSQISHGGIPWGYLNEIDDIEFIEMDNFNIRKTRKQSLNSLNISKAVQYAKTFKLDLSINNNGNWKILEDGTKLWFLGLKSKKAYSIGIIFSEYKIPPGSKLFIYNSKKTHLRGAFTEKNNKPGKSLTIAPVIGDEIIIEGSSTYMTETIKKMIYKGDKIKSIARRRYSDPVKFNLRINQKVKPNDKIYIISKT